MRYATVETVSFEGADGRALPVKELREIPAQQVASIVVRNFGEDVDDTASREDVFGGGAEGESYRLWEANAVEIADCDFDLARIKELRVPI